MMKFHSQIIFLFTIAITILNRNVFALTLNPGTHPELQIGDNLYTVGFNLVIPPSPPSTSKYYEMSTSNDHTAVVQKAITDIGLVGGGTIYFQKGKYLVNNNIVLVSNLHLTGDGSDQTVFKLIDGSNSFNYLFYSKSRNNIAISKIGLNGNRNSLLETTLIHGINLEITNNIWLDQIRVYGFPGHGIFIRGRKTTGSQYLTMTKVFSYENTIDCVKIDQTKNTIVSLSVARQCGDNGFNFASEVVAVDVSGSSSSDNGFYNSVASSGCGYMLQNNMITIDNNIHIHDSSSSSNKKAGICFDDSQNFQATKNQLNKEDVCFFFSGVNAIKVTNNTCTNTPNLYRTFTSTVVRDLESYVPSLTVYVSNDNIFTLPQPIVSISDHLMVDGSISGFQNQIEIGDQDYTIGFNLCSKLVNTASQKYYNITSSTNPRVVIQTALNDAAASGGGIVRLLAGTYLLDAQIEVGSHIHLTGAGMDLTILKLKDWAIRFPKAGLLRTRLTEHIILSNFTLDGNKYYQFYDENEYINYGRYGIFSEATMNMWFDRVKVTQFQSYGFDPHGWKSGMVWGNYLTITNCVATFNDMDGFTLDQTTNIVTTGCLATDNGRHGFNIVTGSKHVTIINNIARNNGFSDPNGGSGCGYMFQNNMFFGTDDIYLAGNFAQKNKKASLCTNDIHNMLIDKNTFTDSSFCYDLTDTTNTVFNNNICNTSKYYKLVRTTAMIDPNQYDSSTQVLITATNTFIQL